MRRRAGVVGLIAFGDVVANIGAHNGIVLTGGHAGQFVGERTVRGGCCAHLGQRLLIRQGDLPLAGDLLLARQVDGATLLTDKGVIHIPLLVGRDEDGVTERTVGGKVPLVLERPVDGDGGAGAGIRRDRHPGDNEISGGRHGDGDRPRQAIVRLAIVFIALIAAVTDQNQVILTAEIVG